MAFQMGDRLHTTVLKITAGTEGQEREEKGEGMVGEVTKQLISYSDSSPASTRPLQGKAKSYC